MDKFAPGRLRKAVNSPGSTRAFRDGGIDRKQQRRSNPLSRSRSYAIVLAVVSMVLLMSAFVAMTHAPDLSATGAILESIELVGVHINPRKRHGTIDVARKKVYSSFLEWDAPGVRDAAGELHELFGDFDTAASGIPRNESDPAWQLQERLTIPQTRLLGRTTCAYLERGRPARAAAERDADRIKARFRESFTESVSRAGERRLSLGARGLNQHAKAQGFENQALIFHGTNVTAAHDEMDALFGDVYGSFWDEMSQEALWAFVLDMRIPCVAEVPRFSDGTGNDEASRFWRSVQALRGSENALTRTLVDDMTKEFKDEATFFGPRALLEIDEHVIGSWGGLRAYYEGRNASAGMERNSVDENISASLPDFNTSTEDKLAPEAIYPAEVRGMCASALYCRQMLNWSSWAEEQNMTAEYFPDDCLARRTPPLFKPLAVFDVVHAQSWTYPMLTAELTSSRAAFLSSLMRAARLCHATSDSSLVLLHCSHGIGHAVMADSLMDIRPEAFRSPTTYREMWARFQADGSTIAAGKDGPATSGSGVEKSHLRMQDPFIYVADCARYGRFMRMLGSDGVFSTNFCLSGFYHQLLVHHVGFFESKLRGSQTDDLLEVVRSTEDGRAIENLVMDFLSDKDGRVLVVMLHHCFMLSDIYIEYLLSAASDFSDTNGGSNGAGNWSEDRRYFASSLKVGVGACFYNTGFFSDTNTIFNDKTGVADRLKQVVLNALGEARSEDEQKDQLMEVIYEACDMLGRTKCKRHCNDSGSHDDVTGAGSSSDGDCLVRCRNLVKAYVSAYCWLGAGAANYVKVAKGEETVTSETESRRILSRCATGCNKLGCNRREWELCVLGFLQRKEITFSGLFKMSDGLKQFLGDGDRLRLISEYYDMSSTEKSVMIAIMGTHVMEDAGAIERFRNLRIP